MNMGVAAVSVCYRLSVQKEDADEALFRRLEEATHLQAFHLMGDSNHPDICWSDNTEGHKESTRFQDHTDDNFLTEVTEELTRNVLCWASHLQTIKDLLRM